MSPWLYAIWHKIVPIQVLSSSRGDPIVLCQTLCHMRSVLCHLTFHVYKSSCQFSRSPKGRWLVSLLSHAARTRHVTRVTSRTHTRVAQLYCEPATLPIALAPPHGVCAYSIYPLKKFSLDLGVFPRFGSFLCRFSCIMYTE